MLVGVVSNVVSLVRSLGYLSDPQQQTLCSEGGARGVVCQRPQGEPIACTDSSISRLQMKTIAGKGAALWHELGLEKGPGYEANTNSAYKKNAS